MPTDAHPRTDASACVHCHACQSACAFLSAHGIDVGDTEQLSDLAYHCFLCGRCAEVCPRGIDGRAVVLQLRRTRVEAAGGRLDERGFGLVAAEKDPYLFKNYRNAVPGSALFPGCNMPSLYPRTLRVLAGMLREEAGMGTVFDCCGKPVDELGLKARGDAAARALEDRLRQAGITELVTVCPGCHAHLGKRLSIRVTGIYEKLSQLGLGRQVHDALPVFPPCPDREDLAWLRSLEPFLPRSAAAIEDAPCCGLGGGASAKEPAVAREMARDIAGRAGGPVFTYCASCAGNLHKNGVSARYLLPAVLGVDESPRVATSLLNRAKTRFWKEGGR